MNITEIIKSNSDLSELPFLVVYRTIQILRGMGMLRNLEENGHVENA